MNVVNRRVPDSSYLIGGEVYNFYFSKSKKIMSEYLFGRLNPVKNQGPD
jgi:hypothetical protein